MLSARQRFGRVHRSVHGDGADILERVLTTCTEMLHDRGCAHVARAADVDAAVDEGQPVLRGRRGARDFDVHVHAEDKVGVKAARSALEAREHDGVGVIMVSVEGPTPFTRKECEGRPMQFFCMRDVCVNVTRHALVPKHERVAAPPAGVACEALPKMLEGDRVAQYHGWPAGTVVRVWRAYGGHEPVPYFRLVV